MKQKVYLKIDMIHKERISETHIFMLLLINLTRERVYPATGTGDLTIFKNNVCYNN